MADKGDVMEAERSRARLQVLARATRMFAEAASVPQTLLENVARQVAQAAHSLCVLTLESPDGRWLEPAAIFDAGGGDARDVVTRLVAMDRLPLEGPHPLARALQGGECILMQAESIVPFLQARFTRVEDQEAARAVGVKSMLFVPLRAHGQNVGAYCLVRCGTTANAFDDDDVQFAHQLGTLAALAIANGRFVEASKQQAARTELLSELARDFALMTYNYRGLLDLIARRFGEVVGDGCSIRVLGRDGRFETTAAVYHPDPELLELHRETLRRTPTVSAESFAAKVLEGMKPILLSCVQTEDLLPFAQPHMIELVKRLRVRSTIGVPILSEGKPIAIAVMTRSAPDHPYTDDDVRMIEDLAAHASIAITNSRLLAERRQIADRLRVLSEASKDFAAATGDPTGLLDMVTRRLYELVGDTATIRLVDDEGTLVDAGCSIYHPDPEVVAATRAVISMPQRKGEGVSGRVLATGKPIMIASITIDELVAQSEPKYHPYLTRLGIRSMLVAPLLAGNRVIGVLSLTRSTPNHPYTEDDLLFTQDLVTHASLAIKNSRLLASVQTELVERQKAEDALRRTEEQLRQAQKMEAVGRLAGGVAHDFNNLLSVILSYSSIMSEDLAHDHPMRSDIAEIHKAGERAADLTRQLLAFSRQQVIEPKILDLNEVVGAMEKMLRRLVGEDVDLRMTRARRLGRVKADPGHVEQVIMNLVVNARDAMPNGGKLTIETANVQLDDAYAREHLGSVAGPHVMIAISDTGTGMDKTTQEHIFEPFFTTKEKGKGTGLGLSTVFGIVKQSGGSIWVYSELHRGTTFKVYLPRTDEVERDRIDTAELPTIRGGETILVVEDDDQVRTVTLGILKRNGYKLIEACNGAEALRWCETHDDSIDLLLTDVVMPEMSGRELSERLAQLRPDLRVLFMSGYTEDAILHHRVLVPGIALLQKPLTPETLLRKVRSVLDAAIGREGLPTP